MESSYFAAEDRMAEVINKYHPIILILQRFGINLGFGEKNIKQVCAQYGVDVQLFLDICNMYAYPEYRPDMDNVSDNYLTSLVEYLAHSHDYYLRERIPHIEGHLKRLAAGCEAVHGKMLLRFYTEYKNEVEHHFAYEEETAFPYILDLIHKKNKKGERYSILRFEENHSNIEDKLEDLTNIIIKYLPSQVLPAERSLILFDLFQFSSDLNSHTHIEEALLIPAVQDMERALR